MTEWQIIAIAVALIVGYQLIAVRLSSAVQPLRLHLANSGEQLLAAEDVPDEIKRHVAAVMDLMFSWRAAWLIVAAMFWVTLGSPFRRSNGRGRMKLNVPHRHHDQLDDFFRSSIGCVLANSPMALLLAALMMFIMLIFSPIDRIGRNAFRALTSMVDFRERHFRH